MVIGRVLLACLILVLLNSCGESEEDVARKIAASEQLTRIDQICAEFPKPPGFRLIKKGVSVNEDVKGVYYQYSSNQPFASIANFYQDAGNRGQYLLVGENYTEPEELISNIRFLRDDVGITLERRPPAVIFSVSCLQ